MPDPAPRTALVTGAARRIGRALALDLAAQGWDVCVHYHSASHEAEDTVAAIRALGRRAAAVCADLTCEDHMRRVVPEAVAALGSLTLLINNASIFEYDDLNTATRESWNRHLESNLRAPYVLTQAFAAQAPEPNTSDGEPRAQASIINMVDQRVWKLTPAFSTYTLAKAGLWTLTQTAAQALAPAVRVNAIGPGPTVIGHRQPPEHFAKQRANTPLQRGASAEEVCAAVRFLLSAPAVTGQMIALDGGQHLSWRTRDVTGATPATKDVL